MSDTHQGTEKLLKKNPPSFTFFDINQTHFLVTQPYVTAFHNFRHLRYMKAMFTNLSQSVTHLLKRPPYGSPSSATCAHETAHLTEVVGQSNVRKLFLTLSWNLQSCNLFLLGPAQQRVCEYSLWTQLSYHFSNLFSMLTPFLSTCFSFTLVSKYFPSGRIAFHSIWIVHFLYDNMAPKLNLLLKLQFISSEWDRNTSFLILRSCVLYDTLKWILLDFSILIMLWLRMEIQSTGIPKKC